MKLLPALLAAMPTISAQKVKPPKECVFHEWENWSACSWLCGPNGTKTRTRRIRLPKDGNCLSNGLEPVLKEVEACNRTCMNGGKMNNSKGQCVCKSSYTGLCCETPKSASVDRCDKRIRTPDGGSMKCGRAKGPALDGSLPWNWACTPRCPSGKGMYRSHGDIYQCNSQGWMEQSFQQRSFDFDDYDDETPTLPLADCAEKNLIRGTVENINFGYVTTMEPAVLQSLLEDEDTNAAVPQSLIKAVEGSCAKPTSGTPLRFTVNYTVSLGGNKKKKEKREAEYEYEEEPVAITSYNNALPELFMYDVGLNDLPDVEVAENPEGDSERSAIAGIPFNVGVNLSYKVKQVKNINWENQELTRQLMRDCVGSLLTHFETEREATDESLEAGGITAASSVEAPEAMEEAVWPFWDRAGSDCAAGSILKGGTIQSPLECQSCPRGTIYLSRQRGAREICRPCPSGTYMGREGAVASDDGVFGECNACPAPSHMTNVFPAYEASSCKKTSCFPNRTKFQVVFALDSSGSVTRPDYIRMREFAKAIVNRMCINNKPEGGSKSCGQAAYVIYNQSAESYMKFKQVEAHVDFNKIDNYEYRGGPARIGDLFEFIHNTYIDTTQYKGGLPLNVVLISDGQTQNDDKEKMEKWTKILKKKVTKIITLSKRSQFNTNTLQVASSMEDRYLMNDYHELPNYVFPIMEKLCESISVHKERKN